MVAFVIELAVGIAASEFRSDLRMKLEKSMKSSMVRSSRDDLTAWDNAQQKLECCGIKGTLDWSNLIRASCLQFKFLGLAEDYSSPFAHRYNEVN